VRKLLSRIHGVICHAPTMRHPARLSQGPAENYCRQCRFAPGPFDYSLKPKGAPSRDARRSSIGEPDMRFMVIVKATNDSENGVMPDEKLLTEMGKYNEELARSGALVAGEGLHPSSKGKRVRFSGRQRTVIDG